MRIYLKDLSKELQAEVRGILRGNGLNASKVRLYKSGDVIVAEHKNTGDSWKIIF